VAEALHFGHVPSLPRSQTGRSARFRCWRLPRRPCRRRLATASSFSRDSGKRNGNLVALWQGPWPACRQATRFTCQLSISRPGCSASGQPSPVVNKPCATNRHQLLGALRGAGSRCAISAIQQHFPAGATTGAEAEALVGAFNQPGRRSRCLRLSRWRQPGASRELGALGAMHFCHRQDGAS